MSHFADAWSGKRDLQPICVTVPILTGSDRQWFRPLAAGNSLVIIPDVEACALQMLVRSSGWSVGAAEILLPAWQSSPGFPNWPTQLFVLSFQLSQAPAAEIGGWRRLSALWSSTSTCFNQNSQRDGQPSELVGKLEKPGHGECTQDDSGFSGSGNLFLWFGAV